jgi:ketosteroid isomerase-like protein
MRSDADVSSFIFAQCGGRLRRQFVAAVLAAAASAAVFGSLAPISPAQAEGIPTVQAGLSEPVRNWVRAVEAGDADAISRMNGPDTIAYVPDAMVVRGSKDISAGYGQMFAKFTARVSIHDAYFIEAGDVVHSWGLYSLTLTPKEGGPPSRLDGRFSDIAARVNGNWRYILDHASMPAK